MRAFSSEQDHRDESGNRLPRRYLSRRITVLLPLFGIIVVALCGLLLFGLATAQVGVLGVLTGVVAALAPVAIVVTAFLWIDRWEPEPAKMLVLGFIWGACVATVMALLINNTAEAVGDLLLGSGNGSKISAVVSAPLAEEAAKAAFVLLMWWRRASEFDGVIDGIVYAGFSAAGFAFTENIFYFGRAFAEDGLGSVAGSGVLATFMLRGVLAPFVHPLFTALTGIGIGIAAHTKNRKLAVFAPLGGYLLAVSLHALWNAAAILGGPQTFITVYFLIMVPIFVGVLLLVLWHRRREQRIVTAELPEMVRSRWIAPSEVAPLASLLSRRKWRRLARKQSGRLAGRAVASYQASVTELAFLRRRMTAGTAGADASGRHAQLLTVLRSSRAEAVRLASGGNRKSAPPAQAASTARTEDAKDR